MLTAFQIMYDLMVAKHQELANTHQEFSRLKADMEDFSKEESALTDSILDTVAKKEKAAEVNVIKLRTLLLACMQFDTPISHGKQTNTFLVDICVA